jgi:hypothetical protein
MRRRSSDLYQVDFVAALFGGFLLIWLSGTAESEFPPERENNTTYFRATARLFFETKDAPVREEGWVSALPQSGLDRGCAHTLPAPLEEGSEKLRERLCTLASQSELAPLNSRYLASPTASRNDYLGRVFRKIDYAAEDLVYWRFILAYTGAHEGRLVAVPVERPARSAAAVVDDKRDIIFVEGLRFQVAAMQGAEKRPGRFLGITVSDAAMKDADKRVLLPQSAYHFSAIGMILAAADEGLYLTVEGEPRSDRLSFFKSNRPMAEAQSSAKVELVSYVFANVPQALGYRGFSPQPNRLEVKLALDSKSGGNCLIASVTLSGQPSSTRFQPC